MRSHRPRRGLRLGVAFAVMAGGLALLRPWTIVPIQSTTARTFDAAGYVASIWDSRVISTAQRSAIDLQTFMRAQTGVPLSAAPTPRAVFVKGTATVADVDRTSRIGLARLRVPWGKTGPTVAIQIGPVLRGTALRDALEFIRFTDFLNQLEFAGVANALNGRVVSGVLAALNTDALAGRDVTFVGAVATPGGSATLEIVPVQLHVAGGAR